MVTIFLLGGSCVFCVGLLSSCNRVAVGFGVVIVRFGWLPRSWMRRVVEGFFVRCDAIGRGKGVKMLCYSIVGNVMVNLGNELLLV